MMSWAPYVAIGLGAGVVSGLFGVGGGLVIVPALIMFAKYPVHSALGTSLGALLLPVALLGVIQYYKAGHLNVTAALFIALGLFFGTYVGAKIVQPISPVLLRRIYAVFLFVVAARLLWRG